MRLSTEIINSLIIEIAGEETVPLVEFLKDKVHISEFKLAEKLELTVNQVRNLLYRLDEHNLVSSMRKKDKKKGWYEYYWTLDLVKVRSLIIDLKKEQIAHIRKLFKNEKDEQYYFCPNKCIRISGEEALELQFKCPECDEILQREDDLERKEKLNFTLKNLRRDLLEATQAVEVRKETEITRKPKRVLKPKKKPPLRKGKKPKKKVKKKIKKKPFKKKKKFRPRKKFKPKRRTHHKARRHFKPKKKHHQRKPLPKKVPPKKPRPNKALPPKKGFFGNVKKKLFKR